MAYVATTNDDDETNSKKSIDLGDSALDAGSSAGTGLGPGEGAGGSGVSPSSGSGFVGINDYLAANKEGSADLGNTVAGGINSTTDAAKSAIDTGTNTFNAKANENKINYNENTVNDTLNTGVAGNDFNKLISGTYAGPKTWADAGVQDQADTAVAKANENATLANTQGGRTQLLQQIISRPMTFGSGNLNSALLSGNEGAVTNVKNTAALAAPLSTNLTNAQTASTTLAGQVAGNNANIKTQTLGRLSNYLTEQDAWQKQAAEQANAAQQQKDAAAAAYLDNLNKTAASETFTAKPLQITNAGANDQIAPQVQATGQALLPAGWEQAGLSQEQAQSLANAILAANKVGGTTALSGYYTAGAPISNVISAADAQRYNALANIAGLGQKYTAGNNVGGAFNVTAAQQALEQSRANGQQTLNNQTDAALAANQKTPTVATLNAYLNSVSRNGGSYVGPGVPAAATTNDNNDLSDPNSSIAQANANREYTAYNDPNVGVMGAINRTLASVGVADVAGVVAGILGGPIAAKLTAAAVTKLQKMADESNTKAAQTAIAAGGYGNTGGTAPSSQATGADTAAGRINDRGGYGSGTSSSSSATGASSAAGRTNDRGGYGSSSGGSSDGGGDDANGGLIVGPGTGTSDSMVRGASNGEYVIPADIVKKYGVDFFHGLLQDHTPVQTKQTTEDRPMAQIKSPSFADRVLSGLNGKNISRDLSSPEETGAADNRLIKEYERDLGRPLSLEEVTKLKNVNFERNKAIKETNRNATPEGGRIDTEFVKPSVDYKEKDPLFQKPTPKTGVTGAVRGEADTDQDEEYANATPFGKTPTPAEQEMIDAVRRGQTKGGVPASIPRSKIANADQENNETYATNSVPTNSVPLSPADQKKMDELLNKDITKNGLRTSTQYLRSLGIL